MTFQWHHHLGEGGQIHAGYKKLAIFDQYLVIFQKEYNMWTQSQWRPNIGCRMSSGERYNY